jgi:hypothetical protein
MINPMRAPEVLMRFMVWQMRWMTRHAGFLARPMVRAYAGVEVIACGLRQRDGRVAIIYTPIAGRSRHHAQVRDGRRWQPAVSVPADDFSTPVVRRLLIPTARVGQRYRMRATSSRGRRLSSPVITIKERTQEAPASLAVTASSGGSAVFSWMEAEACDPMIYFLAVEDRRGRNIAAIYTRETSWAYPRTETASLSLGPPRPPSLIRGASYTARLVVVDYQGWVSQLADRSFTA